MARKRRSRDLQTDLGNPWPRVEGPVENDWTVTTDWTYNGRRVEPGTELSFVGVRGRYRFVKHVQRPNGVEWVDVWGGPGKEESFRSFRPERIRTVHYKNRTDKNLLKARKEAKAA